MRFAILFGLLFSLMSGNCLVAQTGMGEQDAYIITPDVDSLVALHMAYNQEFPEFSGYRIQLMMESGNHALTESEELVAEFSEKYPEVGSYITFREPYYRVRIGDFRTRLEAENFLSKITRKYPSAWVIQDDIVISSLLQQPKANDYE